MKKRTVHAFVATLATVGLMQLVPVDRSNPPVVEEVAAPPAVRSVLARACYDCHSHETRWPWYSRVAPISWLVASDVREGREELNFSTWNRYGAEKRAKMIRESWKEVEEGEMPPFFYVPLHPEARLSQEDRDVLRAWAETQPPAVREDHDAE